MREFLRLITGRIAFEREARLAAVRYATCFDEYLGSDAVEVIYAFLLTGEWPR